MDKRLALRMGCELGSATDNLMDFDWDYQMEHLMGCLMDLD